MKAQQQAAAKAEKEAKAAEQAKNVEKTKVLPKQEEEINTHVIILLRLILNK